MNSMDYARTITVETDFDEAVPRVEGNGTARGE
ncbi:hypothetical protein HNR25_001896 [Streptomonospora salina]|uniref:Uncharacterized protein n=1 Tax=Streptomonospora salina TaxID=104205 RepID=A0A841E4T5_9ACTN|nr:hypothetical protein [Streptomonospora salina]